MPGEAAINESFLTLCFVWGSGLILTWLLSRFLTGISGKIAVRFGIISRVTGRSSHSVPIPRLGGIGAILALLAGLTYCGFCFSAFGWVDWIGSTDSGAGWLCCGLLVMFVLGILDDLFDLPPLLKLILTLFFVTISVIGSGVVFGVAGSSADEAGMPWFCILLTVLWILFFTHGFNFMDGMDGLAGTFAMISGLFMTALLLLGALNIPEMTVPGLPGLVLSLLAASCAGFLAWNRPPARIFMGDGGSLAIGYLLGSLVVVFSRELAAMDSMAWLTGMTVLVPFIFDVLLTLVRRWKNRENLMQAHREHLYQRLMISGMGHEAVLRLNIRYFIVCGALALAGQQFGGGWGRVIAGLLAAAVMLHYWHGVLRLEQEKKIGP